MSKETKFAKWLDSHLISPQELADKYGIPDHVVCNAKMRGVRHKLAAYGWAYMLQCPIEAILEPKKHAIDAQIKRG